MSNRLKTTMVFMVMSAIVFLFSAGSIFADQKVHVNKRTSVTPLEQCYQFTADYPTDTCGEKSSTWLIVSDSSDACNVEVWAAYGPEVTCANIREDKKNLVESKDLKDITISLPDNKQKKLSDALIADTDCTPVWLRFIDNDKCNIRCTIIGGVLRCR